MDEQEKPKSYIVVNFKEAGSVLMNIQSEGVSALQLLALSEYLQLIGKNQLLEEIKLREEQIEQQKLSVPKNEILRAGR